MLCQMILEHRPHPEQGFRACLGIVRLARPFGAGRVEAACLRGLQVGARTYGSVRSILDNKLDAQPVFALGPSPPDEPPPASVHPNVRGSRYYN
jgi:transposase